MSFERELAVARAAAVEAGNIALRYQAQGISAETKDDDSPVTIADRESEKAIARRFQEAFPGDGILAEEGSTAEARSGRRWIVDPIDGTRDFVRGHPNWAVLIGLESQGEVVLGVAHLPARNETFYALRGGGAWCNEARIRISNITDVSRSVLCMNGFNIALELPFGNALLQWMEPFWAVRSFGGCVDAMMIASGQAEVWIEPTAKAWDLAPLKIIIEEAGGSFFNFDGGDSIYGGNCVACVPALAGKARELVGPPSGKA